MLAPTKFKNYQDKEDKAFFLCLYYMPTCFFFKFSGIHKNGNSKIYSPVTKHKIIEYLLFKV